MGEDGIRIGIGGWSFPPWRGTFYPTGLPQRAELAHAASRLGAIEINATYYRLQSPDSFAAWAAAVPEDFRFAVKASRFATNRRDLAGAGESVARFLGQGLDRLGARLGPVLWQFMPAKRFDPDEMEAFLDLLPDRLAGAPLRHALEVRHESFADPRFVAMARARRMAIVLADKEGAPVIADRTAGFAYVRLQRAREEEPAGYSPAALDRWAERALALARGAAPEGVERVEDAKAGAAPGPVFLFMINGAKVRAPAAAEALIARLGGGQRDGASSPAAT